LRDACDSHAARAASRIGHLIRLCFGAHRGEQQGRYKNEDCLQDAFSPFLALFLFVPLKDSTDANKRQLGFLGAIDRNVLLMLDLASF
jgi:hypothetical protein